MDKYFYFFYAAFMSRKFHPLSVHLGMVAAHMHSTDSYTSQFNPSLNEHDAVEIIRGIQMYQAHSFSPASLPTETVWREGDSCIKNPVFSEVAHIEDGYPLLLVPSLINKANILDLCEARSMLRWFNQHGVKTYLLDWGEPDHNMDMDGLVREKLCGAIQAVLNMEGKPVDVLGYCMGGTLSLLSAAFAAAHIRRMALLAAPWDFKDDAFIFGRNVRLWSNFVLPVIEERGHLPSEWIQALFASFDPDGSAQKFMRFANMDQESDEAKLFVAVEDWLNDGVDLPRHIAQDCIQDWFIGNKLASGEYVIGEHVFDPAMIDKDVLVLASRKDRLVPFDCAMNVQQSLSAARVNTVELNCGHVGLIVGRDAVETVWRPVLEWLESA